MLISCELLSSCTFLVFIRLISQLSDVGMALMDLMYPIGNERGCTPCWYKSLLLLCQLEELQSMCVFKDGPELSHTLEPCFNHSYRLFCWYNRKTDPSLTPTSLLILQAHRSPCDDGAPTRKAENVVRSLERSISHSQFNNTLSTVPR